ncbi:uncharacterized protein DUF4352 [Micromonospora sp. M71_S20]|uniref:DUF4352 domain-containing protein n=1 Tax=Micromonospora sp. M71_S20 TaxID=592872 RepID=UPI000EAF3570|nr:DUF4352 domain-containing protein [Micromonospora sp. M71_S20]RLK23669.1 uncharacterized protein DUF4352 [Micromonospora sp. M71_S20]
MSHPPPPYGPQDPNQPNPEQQQPQQPQPPAPMPQFPADQGGYPPQPPTSGAPQTTGDPWAPLPPVPPQQPAGDPWAAPQPPVSGVPQPPVSGMPQPPVSGVPGEPWAAPHQPTSGTPYPPPGYPAGGPGYPPPGGPGYPGGAPGYPLGAPHPVTPPKKNKTVLIVVAVVAVLALLCCVGGVVALVAGANKAANDLEKAAAPRITLQPDGPSPSAKDGETFNMKPGATLVVSDDEGTIEITVTRFTTETKGCRSYAPAPDKGMYLIAHVTATVTKGKSSINPFYFNWVAANGTTANGLASALSGCGDTLGSGNNLREGSKRAGTVVFNVADKNGALEYQHKFQTSGSWKP